MHLACPYAKYTFSHAAVISIDTREEISNGSTTPWTGNEYRQLQRVPLVVAKSGLFSVYNPEAYAFAGAAWYSPQDKFQKLALRQIRRSAAQARSQRRLGGDAAALFLRSLDSERDRNRSIQHRCHRGRRHAALPDPRGLARRHGGAEPERHDHRAPVRRPQAAGPAGHHRARARAHRRLRHPHRDLAAAALDSCAAAQAGRQLGSGDHPARAADQAASCSSRPKRSTARWPR